MLAPELRGVGLVLTCDQKDLDLITQTAKRQHIRGMGYRNPSPGYKTNAQYYNGRLQSTAVECALSRLWDMPWPKDDNTFDDADVGHWLQVKWTDVRSGGLIVNQHRPNQKRAISNFAYILFEGKMPHFSAIGWIGGAVVEEQPITRMKKGGGPVHYLHRKNLRTDFKHLELIARSGCL